MSILQGVLAEEINRLERNISSYEEMLKSLPRGSIFIRKIGNSFFVYRRRRENGEVVSEYLGNKNSNYAQEEIKKSNDYKRIKDNLRVANNELNKLKRAYKVYEQRN